MFAANWVKTNGGCRFPNGQSNLIANKEGVSLDACKDFCLKNPKCDSFDTGGGQCWLFQNKGGMKHTGDGKAKGVSCYVKPGNT